VGIANLIYRALASWPRFSLARTPALYAIGSIAAYWSIGRITKAHGSHCDDRRAVVMRKMIYGLLP
jgi:hypothetical protein